MSLRVRLLLTLGATLLVLWGSAAAWLMWDLEEKVVETLDQRLAQSARMVAGLMLQLPPEVWEQADQRALSIPPIEGLACQVHSPRGEIMARTHTDMEDILTPGERGHAYREEGDMTWRVFTYERGGLTITTADRMDERDMLLSDVMRVAVVPFVVALVGSLLALWLVVWRGLAPLTRLRESLAKRHPDWNWVGVEVYPPGVGKLLLGLEAAGQSNVRVVKDDAVDFLAERVPRESLSAVYVFFPDPWTKARHNKRRLIQAPFLDLLAERLVPGGELFLATDWGDYAEWMVEVLEGHSRFVNVHGPGVFAPRCPDRPLTKFEVRGESRGYAVYDLHYRRDPGTAGPDFQ